MLAVASFLQEVPGQKQTEVALDNLAGQGILGSLCVLLIIALFFSIRALLKAKDDRFGDQRLMSEALEKHNEAAKDLAVEMNRSAANLVLESSKNMELVRSTLSSQERSIEDLSRDISSLQQESVQLRVAISNIKGSRE